jgi:hypothetical protein
VSLEAVCKSSVGWAAQTSRTEAEVRVVVSTSLVEMAGDFPALISEAVFRYLVVLLSRVEEVPSSSLLARAI